MDCFVIEGTGKPIGGEINISGNKNAILPMIAATLLTDEEVLLHNVPDIVDVNIMLQIAESLGTEVIRKKNTLKLKNLKDIKKYTIKSKLYKNQNFSFICRSSDSTNRKSNIMASRR